jgi:hypothetical protein
MWKNGFEGIMTVEEGLGYESEVAALVFNGLL